MKERLRLVSLVDIAIICLSLGLAISPIYNRYWNHLGTFSANLLFIIGFFLILFYKNRKGQKNFEVGSKLIWIPLLVIVLSSISGIFTGTNYGMPMYLGGSINIDILYTLYLGIMFYVFLSTREIRERIWLFIVPISLIHSIVCLMQGIFNVYPYHMDCQGSGRAYGLTHNPDAVSAILAFSIIFYRGKFKWLIPIPLVAIWFTGSWIAIFVIVLLGFYSLYQQKMKIDKKWFLSMLIVLIVFISFLILFTDLNELWGQEGALDKIENGFDIRFDNYELAMDELGFIGNGFQFGFNNEASGVIHNVPLIIAWEFGIIAGLCWIWIIVYSFWKTNGLIRLAILAVFLLSLGDCYLWRMNGMAPYFWTTIGVASAYVSEDNEKYLIKERIKNFWNKIVFNGRKIISEERGSVYGFPYGLVIGTLWGILFIPMIISGSYWLIPLALFGILTTGYLFYRKFWKEGR